MTSSKLFLLVLVAMIAFAGNSVLTRLALRATSIDATSFTTIRIISGALILFLISRAAGTAKSGGGNIVSALALCAYAVGFSFAYVDLSTGTGALLLFGAVQITMIGSGIWRGERLSWLQVAGVLIAFAGLIGLLLPGISAPSLSGSLLMAIAGIAWGVYSIRGKSVSDPISANARNFLLSVPVVGGFSLVMWQGASLDEAGVIYAIISGGLASGVGYAVWYTALPFMLNIDDTHIVTYSLKKLQKLELIESIKEGSEKTFKTTKQGADLCMEYRNIRSRVLIENLNSLSESDVDLRALAKILRTLSGFYDQAARSAATF